jgi:hypothetical protein
MGVDIELDAQRPGERLGDALHVQHLGVLACQQPADADRLVGELAL